MLHELLVSLLGLPTKNGAFYSGSIPEYKKQKEFQTKEGNSSSIHDAKMGISKRSEVDKLLPLGSFSRNIQHFISSTRNSHWDAQQSVVDAKEKPLKNSSLVKAESPIAAGSLYRVALASGLEEILAVYRGAILKAEEDILRDPLPRVSLVTQRVEIFQTILPVINALIQHIASKDLSGGQLLNLLERESLCGVPILKECMTRLLWHCNFVLMRQLSSWTMYGILNDPYDEFFITSKRVSDGSDSSNWDWDSDFWIREEMLPAYVSKSSAEKLLFAGKAAKILRNPKWSASPGGSTSDKASLSSPFRTPASTGRVPAGTPKSSSLPRRFSGAESDEKRFLESDLRGKLQAMKDSPHLKMSDFEVFSREAQRIAAQHLWQLIMVQADVSSTLNAIKDYFLMGKGDLLQSFLDASKALMRLTPNSSTAQTEVNKCWKEAGVKLGLEDDFHFQKVELLLPRQLSNPSTNSSAPSSTASSIDQSQQPGASGSVLPAGLSRADRWRDLSLSFAVEWPLSLFLTPETMQKYNLMFRHLLHLRRVQADLDAAWNGGRVRAKGAGTGGSPGLASSSERRFWSLRRSMADLVTHLQFYTQVDVIETQWSIFQARLSSSRDFTEIVDFHKEFLDAVLLQSFQNFPVVLNIIDPTLECCLRFCRLVERSTVQVDADLLQEQHELFKKQSKSLYMLLNSPRLAGTAHAPFLRQLLLRLNFNKFYERTVVEEGTRLRFRNILPAE